MSLHGAHSAQVIVQFAINSRAATMGVQLRYVNDNVLSHSSLIYCSALNPYKYTSVRWLHHKNKQRRARHIYFGFNVLCCKAIESCPGASRVIIYEKKEGGLNCIFVLRMDNDSKTTVVTVWDGQLA